MIQSFLLYITYTILALTVIIITFLNLAPQFGSNPTKQQIKTYETFKNFKDGGFESLEETPMMTGEVSTWDFFTNQENRRPDQDIVPKHLDYSNFSDVSDHGYKISWLGHSAFIINI